MQEISTQNKIRNISFLGGIKIAILVIVAIAMFANIIPYFEGINTLVYGTTAINLVNGEYGFSHSLLAESEGDEFLPRHYAKSQQDTVIPFASSGMTVISTFSFLVAGYYGLFYLGPVLGILFLITSERVATKLFGSFVGLITLVFLVTDFWILKLGTMLMADLIFSLLLILGIFYLIKFFHVSSNKFILFSSIFLAGSAFFRYSGMIFFPIECLLVLSYFILDKILHKRTKTITNNSTSLVLTNPKISKYLYKTCIYILIPWIVYFSFWFSYNAYFFGDPFTQFYEEANWPYGNLGQRIPDADRPELVPSLLTFDSYRFEWIIFHGHAILPDVFDSSLQKIFSTDSSIYANNFLPSFSLFSILLAGLGISLYQKKKRIDIIVLLAFVLGFVFFFSSYYATYIGLIERYMVPVLSLSFIIIGFVIHWIWSMSLGRILKNQPKKVSIIFKFGLLFILILGAFVALTENKKIQSLLETDFGINNPVEFTKRYPLEKFSEKSIIVESFGHRTVEYNVIPFNPGIEYWTLTGDEPDTKSKELIQKLENLLISGYDVYTFKEQIYETDPPYFRYLEKNHGIVLKEYSETFCKMELSNELEKLNSDDVCYIYFGY